MTANRILCRGFTLMELAVVLVIVALLIGGMLVPLSGQMDIRDTTETQKRLNEIRDAILGFAVINGRLPCPTSTADPANANYGREDCTIATEGYLPWKTLGVAESDAWGSARTTAADPFIGFWRYRVDTAFATPFTLTTVPASNLSVQNAAGQVLTDAAPNSPVAIIYSTGANKTRDGQNAGTVDAIYQGGEQSVGFDDMAIWISRPVLFNRMVAAGKLP